MPRLLGVDIPGHKSIYIGLSHIYGIGLSLSKKIIQKSFLKTVKPIKKMSESERKEFEKFMRTKVQDLSKNDLSLISHTILKLQESKEDGIYHEFLFEGDLRKKIADNIKNKIEINSYAGIRHKRGLPVHGQRTRTNARTRKGPRKTVANKKIEGK